MLYGALVTVADLAEWSAIFSSTCALTECSALDAASSHCVTASCTL